jgi:hypothetical protein
MHSNGNTIARRLGPTPPRRPVQFAYRIHPTSGLPFWTKPFTRRPHRGMTKAQVHRWYGEADDIRVSSHGEIWSYFFNRGHYRIPYYFGKPRTATFTFNAAGILTDFEYNEEK